MDASTAYCQALFANGEALPEDPEYWRAGHTLDYCPTSNRLLLFGGYEGPNELWTLNNASAMLGTTADEPEPIWVKRMSFWTVFPPFGSVI